MADLKAVYRALDPFALPTDGWYVHRADDPFKRVFTALELEEKEYRVLVGGQHGVGKTTELQRLAERVSEHRGLRSYPIDIAPTAFAPFAELESCLEDRSTRAVAIVDGIENIDAHRAMLLLEHLSALPCSVVATVPISFLFAPGNFAIAGQWDRRLIFPAVAIEVDANREMLAQVLIRRAGSGAFESSAIERLVTASGGLIRDLISHAKLACLNAAVRSATEVTESDVVAASEQRTNEIALQLSMGDLDTLKRVWRTRVSSVDSSFFSLIDRNLILAYQTDRAWFHPHPLVVPIFQH